MNFISCCNPKKIVRHGEEFTVPCGKCDYCKYIRNISIAERLRLESQYHKYCIFFTLKYADPFLPRMLYSDSAKGFYVSNDSVFDSPVEQDSGIFINWPFLQGSDASFVDACMNIRGYLPRVRKYDAQCFIKRLRSNIKRHIFNNENYTKLQYVSYALCGEYGPSSFRPHYHGLLFFDSVEIAKNFRSLLHESWPYGSSSFRFSSDARSCRYVAQYVNSSYRLPSFYQSKEICPFLLLSKACPVGYCAISTEEVQKSFRSCSPEITIFDREKGTFIKVPLWRNLENKLYPRIIGFNCLNNWQRVRVYRFISEARSPQELADMINDIFLSNTVSFLNNKNSRSFIYDYFFVVIRQVLSLNDFNAFVPGSVYDSRLLTTIKSLYYTVRRFFFNLCLYDLTVERYVEMIDRYFLNKSNYLLSNQFDFEKDVMCEHPEWLPFLFRDVSNETLDLPPVRVKLDTIRQSFLHSKKNRCKREFLSKYPQYKTLHQYSDCDDQFIFV